MKQGNLEGVIEMLEKVRNIGSNFNYSDPEFCVGLANYAKFLFDRGHFSPALENIQLARCHIRGFLEKNGFNNKPVDINKDISVKNVLVLRIPKEEVKAADSKDKRTKTPEKGERAPVKEELISASLEFETNSGLIPFNIYINYLEISVKIDAYYAEFMLQEDFKSERISEIYEDLVETDEISNKTLHINTSLLISIQYLKAKSLRLMFIKSIKDFQESYRSKGKEKRRYRKIAEKYPDYSLASGKTLLLLPNFSHRLTEEWLPLLDKSKETLEKAVQLSIKESILYSPHLIFLELYQVLLLQREYRPRVGYKYLSNPGESEKKETPFEELLRQESAKVHKLTKESIKALQLSIDLFNTRENVKHFFSQFSTAPVTDLTKIPKIVTQEILETDYLQKKKYLPGLFEESKKKTLITSIDLITYLLKQYLDTNFVSFGRE